MAKTETILFEARSSEGSFTIKQALLDQQLVFIYCKNQVDFGNDTVNEKANHYYSFEDAFQYINEYSWPLLNIKVASKDYHKFMLGSLMNKLPTDGSYFDQNQQQKSSIEDKLEVLLEFKNGSWFAHPVNKTTIGRWRKANISYQNYRTYLSKKENKFVLTLVDLLYVSNFKGGNATINEDEEIINFKLITYSKHLYSIQNQFQNMKLKDLETEQVTMLIKLVGDICALTEKDAVTAIDGFSASYLSALLNAYFPDLIPILDRRVLNALGLVEENPGYQNQVKNIRSYFPALIRRIHDRSKGSDLSLREIDQVLFAAGDRE